MNNLQDGNKRTIWFAGDPGPMVPKNAKVVGRIGGTGSKVPKSGSGVVKVKNEPKENKPMTKIKNEPEEKKPPKKVKNEPKEKPVVKKEATKKAVKREVKEEPKKDLPVPTKRSKRTASTKSANFYTED